MSGHLTSSTREDLAHTKYRADIDGLRAVAVLSVVGFHAFPAWIRGGFVGVDVFFVISGFLISTILLGSLDGGVFSFKEFYVRRIVRIFPALLTVLVFCFALGWLTLYADEYKQLGKHIAAGAGFLSNFIYWQEAGYFDKATELKPLLHLWSLGIEEQFYFVWPLALYLVYIGLKRRGGLLLLILFLTTVSFVHNVTHIKADVVAIFYSPASRAWELMLGSILSYLTLFRRPGFMNTRRPAGADLGKTVQQHTVGQAGRVLRTGISLLGIALILMAAGLLDKTNPFPGKLALLPALGAGLLISSGPHAWVNRYILSNRLMVWIGLISYPLYLWHWPLLSFARIFEGAEPRLGIRIAVVGVSLLLAWATYYFIEKPIRYGELKKLKAAILCCLIVVIGCAGYYCYRHDGLSHRDFLKINKYDFESPEQFNNWKDLHLKDCSFQSVRSGKTFDYPCQKDGRGDPQYALIGDSKARALYPSLVKNSNGNRWLFIDSFPLITESKIYGPNILFKPGAAEALIDWLAKKEEIKVVVITLAARSLFVLSVYSLFTLEELPRSPNYGIVYNGLNPTIKKLIAANKQVVITVDNPTLQEPRCCVQRKTVIPYFGKLFAKNRNPGCAIGYDQHLRYTEPYRRLMNNLKAENPALVVYDPTHLLCNIGQNECAFQKNGELMYSYFDHISTYAASLIAGEFIPIVENMAQRN